MMGKPAADVVILISLLSIGDGRLFSDGTDGIEESISPFLYHNHVMYNLYSLKEVIEEHGAVYLVIPSDPPMEIHIENRTAGHFPMKKYGLDMHPLTEEAIAQDCFYHGRVSGHEDSFAVIDGCQAPDIRGYISVGGKVLLLEPAEDDDGAHILRTSHTSRSALRTFFSTMPISKRGITDKIAEGETLIREPRQLPQEAPPLFIEVYVVCDNALFEQFNRNSTALQAKIQMIIEVLKEIFLDLGVYIHLSGMEVWNTGNHISPRAPSLRGMFDDFLVWRRDNLDVRHDFPMFISGTGYSQSGSSPPLVYISQICSAYYTGLAIKELNLDDPILPSILARHIGFNMGLRPLDLEQCPCSHSNGCIMDRESRGGIEGPPTKFSSCSKQALRGSVERGGLNCLRNRPARFVFPPRCGDGNVDAGEDCDCGLGEECLDICCDAATCAHDYSVLECRPTTLLPSTTQSTLQSTTQANPTTTPPEPTTTPLVYETTYMGEFVTEVETYDFTTSADEAEALVSSTTTVSPDITTLPATMESALTEEELRIRRIKAILGAQSVQVPPTLIQGPTGGEVQYFTVGSNVSLPCEVSGLPLPSISWYKDEDELNIDGDALLSIDDGSLKIIGADPSDAGDYYCKANNTHGVVISETVSLSLAYLDSLSTNLLEIYEISERDSLVLRCQIPGSYPPPEVYWTKDLHTKEPVEVGGGVSQTPTGDLVISSARPGHTGDYTCIVSNPETREVRVTQSILVKVKALAHPPIWEFTSPHQMTVQHRKPFSLHCIPSGSPIPSVQWEKLLGGGEGTELKGYGQTLTIPTSDEYDSGQYRCTATNGVGESVEEVFNITVGGAPQWTAKPTNVEIPAGSSHSVHCAAGGIPLPDMTWLVNGNPAHEEVVRYPHLSFSSEPGSGVFNITDGTYLNVVLQCVAENSHGRLIANAYVNIIVFPARIISPPPSRVSIIEGQDVQIPCQALGAPEPEIYWQVGVKELEAEEDGSLVIPAVGVGDANSYYCRVRNKYGHQDAKVLLHVRGLTQVAISTDEVSVEEESELILTCQVEHHADKAPEIKWSKQGGLPLDYNRTLIEFNHDMTMSSLLIERLTVNDTGFYVCTAMTDYDEVSDQANVEVTEKIIIRPPIRPGNISIALSPPSGLLVVWEPEYLPDAPVDSFLVEARNNFDRDLWYTVREVNGDQDSVIVKVNPYVGYWFRVTARNEAGESVSARSRPVWMPSSTPLHNPRNVQVEVMDTRNVRVTWEEMGPLEHAGPRFFYRVRWRALGTKRWQDVKIRDHTITEHSFEMDQRDSPGLEVAVKSGNSIGSGPRAIFVSTLFVQPTTAAPLTFDIEPPIFSRVMEDTDIRLNCSGVGGADLQTSWYKDGILVESDFTNYTIGDDGSLLISFFGYEDVGEYECSIESSNGEMINALTHLEIRRKTRVAVLPSELEAVENSPIEVFCDVEFDTNVISTNISWVDPLNDTVQFYDDGIDARIYRNDTDLIIERVSSSDAGMYRCIAETEQDYAEALFTLMVEVPEPPLVSPQSLMVQVRGPTSISASWAIVPDEDAGGPVQGYFAVARLSGEVQGERKECFTVSTRCHFVGLTPSLTYEVFVAVRTSIGQGPFSSAVLVTIPDPRPIRPGPVLITRTRVWAKTLTIKWDAPTIGDPLYGYLLSYKAENDELPEEKTLTPQTTQFKMVGLVPGTRYTVSLLAYNQAGRGQMVTKVVRTKAKNDQG